MPRGAILRYCLAALFLVAVGGLTGCAGSQPNPALNLGGIDVGAAFDGQMSRVKQIMGNVNSLSSADKAASELEEVSLYMDDLVFNSQKLSPEGQTALSMKSMKAVPDMESLISMVGSSPALGEKLGGVLEGILAKMKQLI